MNNAIIDDSRIETRFVFGRIAVKHARAMNELIRAFQSDGWAMPRNVISGKRQIKRRKNKSARTAK